MSVSNRKTDRTADAKRRRRWAIYDAAMAAMRQRGSTRQRTKTPNRSAISPAAMAATWKPHPFPTQSSTFTDEKHQHSQC